MGTPQGQGELAWGQWASTKREGAWCLISAIPGSRGAQALQVVSLHLPLDPGPSQVHSPASPFLWDSGKVEHGPRR